ncbi:putative carboxypeptidase C [Helianthus anomalus]
MGVPGGVVNFGGVGPLDFFLKPTNLTWLKKADLLFVDNPVGSGYSYVEDEELLAKTDEEVATDLITLLTEIFNKYQTLQKKPLYIVGWSYGAKFAATLGLLALKAIENNKLKLILGGIVLADGYISPEDYVASWGPLLKDVSRIDENGLIESNSVVKKIKQQIANGNWKAAEQSWNDLVQVIHAYSNNVVCS